MIWDKQAAIPVEMLSWPSRKHEHLITTPEALQIPWQYVAETYTAPLYKEQAESQESQSNDAHKPEAEYFFPPHPYSRNSSCLFFPQRMIMRRN